MLDICPALTHRVCNIIISINIYPKIDLVAIKISLNKFLKKKKWDLVTNRMGHPLPWTCCWRKRESRKNKKKYFEKKRRPEIRCRSRARDPHIHTHRKRNFLSSFSIPMSTQERRKGRAIWWNKNLPRGWKLKQACRCSFFRIPIWLWK